MSLLKDECIMYLPFRIDLKTDKTSFFRGGPTLHSIFLCRRQSYPRKE